MSNGDPIGSELPKGKSNAKRMGRYDGSFTGSEQRLKNELMRQFMKTGEGPGGNSDAYRNASCWCASGKLKADGEHQCSKCIAEYEAACDRLYGPGAWTATRDRRAMKEEAPDAD